MRKTKVKRSAQHFNPQSLTNKAHQRTKALHAANELMAHEKFAEAAKHYAALLEQQPDDYVVLSNMGAALVKLGDIKNAKVILEYAVELNPRDGNARLNLGAVYQATKDYEIGLKNALDAVAAMPTSSVAFNNLGCAFASINMLPEALHAYETATQLNPEDHEAALNVAMTLQTLGYIEVARQRYESLLDSLANKSTGFKEVVKFYASFAYLQTGDLKKGWEYYESGFNSMIPVGASRQPFRQFNFPQWRGESLKDKRLLIWREQGIGDELLFSSCMIDLLDAGASITFECSARYVETYKRSFPNFQVRPEFSLGTDDQLIEKETYDYHIPVGSLPGLLRAHIEDFEKQRPFIKSNPVYRQDFKNRLQIYRGKKLVGICWRSGMMDPTRNREYTSLVDWGHLLRREDCVFVNLQYGDCETELLEAENLFGIRIIRWNDLDLKNDLDRVFSLMSCLDCVVSANTAVHSMAGSQGIPVVLLDSKLSWSNLACEDHFPWYPKTVLSGKPNTTRTAEALIEAPMLLNRILEKSDA